MLKLLKKLLIGEPRIRKSTCFNTALNLKTAIFSDVFKPINRTIKIKSISENIQQYIILLQTYQSDMVNGNVIKNPVNVRSIKEYNLIDFFIVDDEYLVNIPAIMEDFKYEATKFITEYESIKDSKMGIDGRNQMLAEVVYNNLCSVIVSLTEVREWKKIS